MRTLILISGIFIGMNVSAQTFEEPIKHVTFGLTKIDYYVWYLNTDDGYRSISIPNDDEGKKFLEEQMKTLGLDKVKPYNTKIIGKTTYKHYENDYTSHTFTHQSDYGDRHTSLVVYID